VSQSQFIKVSGLAFMAGSFAFIAMLSGSVASPIITSILLATGMLGLRAGYGESVGSFGKNILLIGVVGMVFIYLGTFTLQQIETPGKFDYSNWWILIFAGPAVLLLALTLFGLTALRRKPMPHFNWLPIFAGIWFPVIYFSLITYLFTNNGAFPDQYWSAFEIMLVIQFLALCLLGFILVTDVLDVEILINRTLVYGTLTASVIGLYVLIVGGLSTLLQTQNNLPNIIIAILLIAFLFQPLRRRLQDIVNRFVPVPKVIIRESIPPPVPQTEQPQTVVVTDSTSSTILRGRWLILARLAWAIGLTALTAMYALGFLAVHDTLSTVCEGELCTLRQQIRHTNEREKVEGWPGPPVGYADRLRPDQVEALERLGLTLDQYGWLGALQMGIPALVLLLIAAGLFWRKSNDWMVLFASIMVATFPLHNTPLSFTLAVRQPSWEWIVDIADIVAFSCLMIFPLVFPTGRFVPRWTRWAAIYAVTGAMVAALFGDTIREVFVVRVIFGAVFLLPLFGTGVYAQLYRYFRLARPAERQQFKWVAAGLVGFVVTQFVLIALDALLTSPVVSSDPARRLILSAIPDTLWQVNSLVIAVSITIAVLRYRLWDIDIFINRALVYGALSAGVVGLYVLIVGWLSIGLQTLPANVFAIMVIAFLFRPLRQLLQRTANRFVPVPRPAPPFEQSEYPMTIPKEQGASDTKLRGRWLILARLAWAAVFIALTAMYTFGFLAVRDVLSTVCEAEPCTLGEIRHTEAGDQISGFMGPPIGYADRLRPDQVMALDTLNLTLDQYSWLGALQMGIPLLIYLLIAAGLFWRKSDDWMVLFVSTMIMTFPLGEMPLPYTLAVRQPVWQWVYVPAFFVSVSAFFIFPLIFPTGRFVPRWMRWKMFFDIAFAIILTLRLNSALREPIVESGFVLAYLILSFCTSAYALSYRYFRVASSLEHQQIKWVVVGVVGFISIAFPLDTFLFYHPVIIDSARALVLSAIPDTIYRAVALFIPVSVGISVLRYRLWDIDIIISRTLVYGTLSVGIVLTYILLIGLLGTLLNTHVSLAAALLTTALTIPFFQPLRLRIQRAVNRLPFGGRDLPSPKQDIEAAQPDSEGSLRPRWLAVIHSAWFVCALLTAIILIGGVPIYYSRYTHPILSDLYNLGQFNVPFQVLIGFGALAGSFISFGLAILIFWRKPNDRMALFVSFFFLIATVSNTYSYFLTPYVGAQASPLNLIPFVTFPLWILLFCIFPDGRFVPRWTRWLFLVSILASFSYIAFPEWFFVLQFTAGPQFILVTYAQVYRYRHVSSDVERKQTKWVVFGWLLTMVLSLIASFIYKQPSGPLINIIPLTVAIAILRSRLWDIDLILNRALVYGALTAGIVALYILLVGTLSLLSQTTGNLLISLLATGLIAFLFQPLRERLQRAVNRLVYGERDDPYVALSRLGRRLEASLAPEAVLPTVVTTVREVLKLPYVAIYLKQEGGNRIVAESASPSLRVEGGRIRVPGMNRHGHCIPLIHQGDTLGFIVLGPRGLNEAFSSTDLRLLDDLAPQVGVAVHAVRLTADLQRSRERLVLAREEERRRLRRDLHDDLGPTLASLGLAASTVAELIPKNPTAATKLVKELESQMRATVGNVRRLVYDLRPPTLDELGLLAAVRERASRYSNAPDGFHVMVEAPAELPTLPAAVEVAAYRIVQEALENVSKHSQARQCTIRLVNHDGLEIEITDDGIGLPPNLTPGVGLRSMRERAEELGGSCVIERGAISGTRVLACLPIGEIDGTFAHPDRG
jgi:signal transduction histidine kinase